MYNASENVSMAVAGLVLVIIALVIAKILSDNEASVACAVMAIILSVCAFLNAAYYVW